VLVETSNPKYPLQADSKQNFGTTLIRSINQLYDFMGYYVKKNFIIIITIVSVSVSGGRYVLFQSETVNNTTNITNNTTNIINNTTNTTNNPPIASIAAAVPIVAQVVIDIESLFEVIDIEPLSKVIDIESLFGRGDGSLRAVAKL
jgi:hypothetical protein